MDGIEPSGQLAVAPSLGGQSADDALFGPPRVEAERRADLAAFIGANAETFMPSYDLDGRTRWRGLCWPGFFFPVAWFMYRKMYGWAALACALPIIGGALKLGPLASILTGASSLVGLAGRTVYVAGAQRTIARMRASAGDQPAEDFRRSLTEAGGVSTAGAWVGGLITVLATGTGFALGFVAGFKAHHP
jgi:hypothetical protein